MHLKYCFPLLLLANAAQAGGGFIGFDLGLGDLDINNVRISPDFDLSSRADDTTVVMNLNGGWEFDNGVILMGETEEADQVNFLGLGDAVEVNVYKLGVGFGAAAAERFRVHGTVGMAFWELDARESFFLNPGPEATGSIDGEDLYFNFGGEFLLNESLGLVFLYNYNDYDFGDATAIRLGVRFRFGRN